MKHVTLLATIGSINAGETASFDDAYADRLIKEGKAKESPVPAAAPTTPDDLKLKLHDAEIGEVHKALDEIQAGAFADVANAKARENEAALALIDANKKIAELEAKLTGTPPPAPPTTDPTIKPLELASTPVAVATAKVETATADAPAPTTPDGK
jgi:hypothetical protein